MAVLSAALIIWQIYLHASILSSSTTADPLSVGRNGGSHHSAPVAVVGLGTNDNEPRPIAAAAQLAKAGKEGAYIKQNVREPIQIVKYNTDLADLRPTFASARGYNYICKQSRQRAA